MDATIKAIQEKIKERGIPQVELVFTFANGEGYTIPILRNVDQAESMIINHLPEFETTYPKRLLSEEIQLIVNYGKGIKV